MDCTISDGKIRIPGYSIARSGRVGRRGGGTCFYYRQHLPIVHAADITSEGVESTWLELRGRQERHLLACTYRQPDATIAFWPKLEVMLHQATLRASTVTLVGDLNVNVDQSNPGAQFPHPMDMCRSYGLRNLVNEPTRVTPGCPVLHTVLDLILARHILMNLRRQLLFLKPSVTVSQWKPVFSFRLRAHHHSPSA